MKKKKKGRSLISLLDKGERRKIEYPGTERKKDKKGLTFIVEKK